MGEQLGWWGRLDTALGGWLPGGVPLGGQPAAQPAYPLMATKGLAEPGAGYMKGAPYPAQITQPGGTFAPGTIPFQPQTMGMIPMGPSAGQIAGTMVGAMGGPMAGVNLAAAAIPAAVGGAYTELDRLLGGILPAGAPMTDKSKAVWGILGGLAAGGLAGYLLSKVLGKNFTVTFRNTIVGPVPVGIRRGSPAAYRDDVAAAKRIAKFARKVAPRRRPQAYAPAYRARSRKAS